MIEVGRADERLEPYRRVGDHRWLERHNLFVAEGRLVVERLVSARRHRIESVLVTPAAAAAMAPVLERMDAPVYVAPQDLLNDITGFNFHRGCLALAHRPAPAPPAIPPRARLVLGLERVGNPDNVGGLFRTAAAFGAGEVLIDAATADPFYRKAIRTSMGAVLDMPFARVDNWPAMIRSLREAGATVAALTPDASAREVEEFAASGPFGSLVLLVGAEGPGLSPEVLELATARVRIATTSRVDSLNVVVAAGIALWRLKEASQATGA